MRRAIKLIGIIVCVLGWRYGQAQTMDVHYYYFSQFQCDPLSCQEQTPTPVFTGYTIVNLNATCTVPGGANHPFTGSAKAAVGSNGVCHSPYTPFSEVSRWTHIIPIDSCDENSVDGVDFIAEIFDSSGKVIFRADASGGCDGSNSGVTKIGSQPC